MATLIRPEISTKNKYFIGKNRYYELKHFCLQYPGWKKIYKELVEYGAPISNLGKEIRTTGTCDPVARNVIMKMHYSDRIDLIEETAYKTDKYLYEYIIKGVTEGHSYVYLKSRLGIPCSRDTYYDRYRKFFWLLNQERN